MRTSMNNPSNMVTKTVQWAMAINEVVKNTDFYDKNFRIFSIMQNAHF